MAVGNMAFWQARSGWLSADKVGDYALGKSSDCVAVIGQVGDFACACMQASAT